ncbi:hypothetical protein P3G55_10120 [Leptospira sp. 96542]|nr:hypothetical protein [Leptospira sp. 96542]
MAELLLINLLIYFLMNGAQIFETLVFVPRWATGNLQNLSILNSEIKSANLKYFWIVFHSVHEIVFLSSVVFCFEIDGVGKQLVILFFIHVFIRIWTVTYFAQKIIKFQKVAENRSLEPSENIDKQIKTWVILNYLRVSLYIGISILMVPLTIIALKAK